MLYSTNASITIDIGQYLQDHPWLQVSNFNLLIPGLINLVLIAAVVGFLFLILLGGIQWMTSGGDKNALENAKNRITAALVGIIIVFSAWAILSLVKSFFGITEWSGPSKPVCNCVYLNPTADHGFCRSNCGSKAGKICWVDSECK